MNRLIHRHRVLTRRSAMLLLGGVGSLLVLDACSSDASTLRVALISENVASIEAGILAISTTPAVRAILPSADMATLDEALAAIRATAMAIASNASTDVSLATGQAWIRALAIQTARGLALVTPFLATLPKPVAAIVGAVRTLLPIVEGMVGLTSAAPILPRMTPAQARATIARGV